MAEPFGIAGLVGVAGEVARDLNFLYITWKASGKVGAETRRVLNLCQEVEGLLKKSQESSWITSALDLVQNRLEDVAKIAAKYKNETRRNRLLNFGMARTRLDDLKVIEGQLGVVLQFLAAHDASEIKPMVEECRWRLIRSEQTNRSGPGTTHGDRWKNSFSSVPPCPSFVETQSIRNLRQSLLNCEKPSRLVTVHGMGGLGKTTACRILANDAQVRQQFPEGIFWIEFGQDSSADAVVDQLVQVTELSGGVEAAVSISEASTKRFERAKSCFQSWFENRAVLFVVDNIWPSDDPWFKKWLSVLRGVPGRSSVVLHSSRTPLGETNVAFVQLDEQEQRAIFLCHLGLGENSDAYKRNLSSVAQILKGCAGLPLTLAMAAALLQNDPNGWKSLSSSLKYDILNPAKCLLSDHHGLTSVFETSLQWLGNQKVPSGNCSLPWDELYFSLSVLDRACPSAPVCVLALMWGTSIETAEEVCRTFVKLSLATLSGGEADARRIMLHDLQFDYCSERCKGSGSSLAIPSESAWHKKLVEALVVKRGSPFDHRGMPRMPNDTCLTGLPARAATADAVVEAYIGLAEGSVLEEYFLKNLVRHICRFEDESFLVLARGVLSDYRWLLAICSRQSLSFAASQYYAVLNRAHEWIANHDGLKASEIAPEYVRGFIRDLVSIAEVFRFCVPPAAVELSENGEREPCPVHGKQSLGDPGLAHLLVGRLGIGSRDGACLVLEEGGGASDDGDVGGSSGVCSLVDMLVGSMRRWAVAPWLVPVNRFYFEADTRGLDQVIRGGSKCCISFFLGDKECVAVAAKEEIRVYNVADWDLIHVMHEEGGRSIGSIAVAGEGCGVKREKEVGDVGVDKVSWLAAGQNDGSVGLWDLDSGGCVTTLHPRVALQKSHSEGVSVAPDWSRVVHVTEPGYESPDKAGLQIWDLSADGTPEGYAFVDGCKNKFGFELASAALLHENSRRRSVEQCRSRAVRFERTSLQPGMRKRKTYFPYLGHRFRKGNAGCPTSDGENELSEATDATLRMRVEDVLVAEWLESNFMACCRVSNYVDRVLIAAVNNKTGVIAVLDALTCEMINEFRTAKDERIWSLAAFQREEDGRVLVVTGDWRGMIRMRVADSGELIVQWQTMQEQVSDVAIAVKAGRVMGAFVWGGLWVWSHVEARPDSGESESRGLDDGMLLPPPSRATNDHEEEEKAGKNNNPSIHSHDIASIAFSDDGKVAASCAFGDKFVLVWDTATGTVTRKLDIDNDDRWIMPIAVAVSRSGDWIVCAIEKRNFPYVICLWGPSNQYFSVQRERENDRRIRCVTIKTSSSEDRLCGEILCGDEKDGYETYEWLFSSGSADPEIILTPTEASEDVVSKLEQTRQGSRELLLEGEWANKLHVRNAALDGVDCCTCKAAAVFDSFIACMSAWSETASAQPGDRAGTSPKVAVGLVNGTVHFMDVRWSNAAEPLLTL